MQVWVNLLDIVIGHGSHAYKVPLDACRGDHLLAMLQFGFDIVGSIIRFISTFTLSVVCPRPQLSIVSSISIIFQMENR